ncbi:conserved membrane hypothetical protein [Enterobacterales bacterium 8AC]|nr:conserved membrane hypothetical protein [Enterobacterales bacterium 8AC]
MDFIYHYWSFFIIPFLYGMMLLVEFVSQFSRVAGYYLEKNAIGYSLQNATLTLTRFFSVLLMPLVGFMIDAGFSPEKYIICILISYFLVGFLGGCVYIRRLAISNFYIKFINSYINNGKMVKSLFTVFRFRKESFEKIELGSFSINKKYFLISCFVYSIHACGVFLTFYFALISPSHKVMITQMSGVINAFATILLTFKIDPALSVAIEKRSDFISAFMSIFIGRIFVFLVTAPVIVVSTYIITR